MLLEGASVVWDVASLVGVVELSEVEVGVLLEDAEVDRVAVDRSGRSERVVCADTDAAARRAKASIRVVRAILVASERALQA